MRVLLDTQVLIWALFKDKRLSSVAAELIDIADEVFVSVVSIYEIDFKRHRPQRLKASDGLLQRMPRNMPSNLPRLGYTVIPVDAEAAWRAASLPFSHGDPWDRILVAQALILDVALVSADQTLRKHVDGHQLTRGLIEF